MTLPMWRPTIPLPWLILIALALVVVARIAHRLVKLLLMRGALQVALKDVGRKALDKIPDEIRLHRATFSPDWKEPRAMEAIARPLLALGFADCGVYTVDKIPGAKVWFLLNEETNTAAFVYEHPKRTPWIEFSVRYEDGTTTALSTMPATGIQPAPFFRRIQADAATPTGELYRRLLAERPHEGIKRVTRDTVVREYEEAYLRMMLWQKNKGLSVGEVATVAKKWLERRRQGDA